MPDILGLHIEENLIKYAKVQVEKDRQPKVGMHGIVFYDNINMAIEQIIRETCSYGAEIATNLSIEMYDYTEVFSGIKKSSLEKHLKLFFAEEVCISKKINPSSFQSRYIIDSKKYDKDNVEVMYISANKADITSKTQLFKRKVKKLLPVSLANLSLIDMDENTNIAVLNIDSSSTVTIVLRGKVKKVININIGMSNILAGLTKKYGSYAKSYKECKSITANSESTKELFNENVDMEDLNKVTPLLYDLGQRLISILAEYEGIVNKLYVTGLGIAINNIDLYFEEMLNDIIVETLKPNFLANNIELSNKIKDFAEVNSAIALAISSGKIGEDNFNFVATNSLSSITNKLLDNPIVSSINQKKVKKKEEDKTLVVNANKKIFKSNGPSNILLQEVVASLLVLIAYFGVTSYVKDTYAKNTSAINEEMENIKSAIKTVDSDTRIIASNRKKYDDLDVKIQELVEQMSELNGITYDVPNLLTSLALIIPDEVKITKIAISTDKKVTIDAECDTYSPLGFFISELKNNQVMNNIKIESLGEKKGSTDEGSSGVGQKVTIIGEIL